MEVATYEPVFSPTTSFTSTVKETSTVMAKLDTTGSDLILIPTVNNNCTDESATD